MIKSIAPSPTLSWLVDAFWMLQNNSHSSKQITILPDGRIDLLFSESPQEAFHATLLGLATHAAPAVIEAGWTGFAISFNPLATEYLLNESVADLLNSGRTMEPGKLTISKSDLIDFELFVIKAEKMITAALPNDIDTRKKDLFDLIFSSKGSLAVKDLSEKVFWSSRQINRYFTQQYGISLKTYCSIIRFRSAFPQLKKGKLFPEENFVDQSHFIKEIKKLSGALPKELSINKNDRFVQFSVLPPQ